MKYIVSLFLLFFYLTGAAQKQKAYDSFQAGESITYDVFYNWSFVWLHTGEVTFQVHDTTYQGQSAFHFYSVGKSFKNYDWIYKVRDTFQTVALKKSLLPLYFSRNTYEGGYEVNNRYYFNYSDNKLIANTYNSKDGTNKKTMPLEKGIHDVLSMIYVARNYNFSSYQPNDKIPIKIIIDGEIFDLYIRYLGKETIESKAGEEYDCIKFSPLLVEGTIFSGGEDMTVWVTDDKNSIPILVEAKILVGSVKAYFRKAENIKYKTQP